MKAPATPVAAYRRLLKRFGPQGWWPVTDPRGRVARYHPGRRRPPLEREALEIAVGAVLTQNTAWTNVEKCLAELQRSSSLDGGRLLAMPIKRLQGLIRSSGYFRQKAVKLKDFLKAWDRRGRRLKSWLKGPLEEVRQELLSLRGIGPETADSILLYAGGRPAFVVDAYTLRIGSRVGWFKDIAYEEARVFLEGALPCSVSVYQEFHALIVALAKFHCRSEPLCGACPLQGGCLHGSARA